MIVYCKCEDRVTNVSRYKALKDTLDKIRDEISVQCLMCGKTSPYKRIEDVHKAQLEFI